jgi:hypothetical protein
VSELGEVLRDLAKAFANTRWYVFGAQAVVAYGVPRLTADVDVTVEAQPDDVEPLVAALDSAGFEPRVSDVAGFVRRTRVVPVAHRASGVPVDVVVAGPGLEEEFLRRVVVIDLDGTAVPVISPEDLLVTKILAGRSRDLDDARGILAERGQSLDIEHVRRLLGLLEDALDRRDLLPAFEKLLAAQ